MSHVMSSMKPVLVTWQHLQTRNFVIACYAVSLTTGKTLLNKRVRHDTLKGYVRMAIKCHTDRRLPSPRLADTDYISVVLDAVRKFQAVPNRREMIHDSMYEYLISNAIRRPRSITQMLNRQL